MTLATSRRATRYILQITMQDGYVEEGAFSRRKDAIRRARIIRMTWPNVASLSLTDTWRIWYGDSNITF